MCVVVGGGEMDRGGPALPCAAQKVKEACTGRGRGRPALQPCQPFLTGHYLTLSIHPQPKLHPHPHPSPQQAMVKTCAPTSSCWPRCAGWRCCPRQPPRSRPRAPPPARAACFCCSRPQSLRSCSRRWPRSSRARPPRWPCWGARAPRMPRSRCGGVFGLSSVLGALITLLGAFITLGGARAVREARAVVFGLSSMLWAALLRGKGARAVHATGAAEAGGAGAQDAPL